MDVLDHEKLFQISMGKSWKFSKRKQRDNYTLHPVSRKLSSSCDKSCTVPAPRTLLLPWLLFWWRQVQQEKSHFSALLLHQKQWRLITREIQNVSETVFEPLQPPSCLEEHFMHFEEGLVLIFIIYYWDKCLMIVGFDAHMQYFIITIAHVSLHATGVQYAIFCEIWVWKESNYNCFEVWLFQWTVSSCLKRSF